VEESRATECRSHRAQKLARMKSWLRSVPAEWERFIAPPIRGSAIWFTAGATGSSRALYSVTLSGRQRLIAPFPGDLTLFDVAKDGRVLAMEENERVELAALSSGSQGERSLNWLDWWLLGDVSNDGKTELFTEAGEGGGANYSVYIRNLDGSPAVRLGEGTAASLSPDGQWPIAYHPHDPGARAAFPFAHRRGRIAAIDLRRDSKSIIVTSQPEGHPPRLYIQSLDGGPARPITPEGFQIPRHAVSPDGKSSIAAEVDPGKGSSGESFSRSPEGNHARFPCGRRTICRFDGLRTAARFTPTIQGRQLRRREFSAWIWQPASARC
jgi:hypothetical protein